MPKSPSDSIASPPVSPTPSAEAVRVSLFERRLNDPFAEPSVEIRLKDPRLVCHWFNNAISPDKVWRAKHVKNWQSVTPAMLVDPEQVGAYDVSPAGDITRGIRGDEVLLCMPRDEWQRIQMAKTRLNLKNMGDTTRATAEVVAAVGAKFGDEAASFIEARVGPVGRVQDSFERIQRREPDEP